jgi:hypothetical protein
MTIASATTGHPTPVPSLLIANAAQVAREGYQACMQGETVHISGRVNQLVALWMQYQPRWLGRAVGGLVTRRER